MRGSGKRSMRVAKLARFCAQKRSFCLVRSGCPHLLVSLCDALELPPLGEGGPPRDETGLDGVGNEGPELRAEVHGSQLRHGRSALGTERLSQLLVLGELVQPVRCRADEGAMCVDHSEQG